jgi:replicative DNA helicase
VASTPWRVPGVTSATARHVRKPGTDISADGWRTCRVCDHLYDTTAADVVPLPAAGPDAASLTPKPAGTSYRARMVDGGAFVHDAPAQVPAVWGVGDDVLMSVGEPLILTGPTGVGKTTLGGQVVAGRLGLLPEVLGYPIQPGQRRVLYLAMDRPAQIARALGRLLRAHPREVLTERLVVWKGPPPVDLARHPSQLLELANEADADTVVIDSLKDAAVKLSDEETGQGISRAMNYCVADGVEVLAFHHQTKRAGSGSGKPTSLADVYGSGWITAGAGSVILLWGAAGDLVVELSHLKQPAAEVGPLMLVHDHHAGTTVVKDRIDVLDLLAGKVTVREVAMKLNAGTDPVTDSDIEKTRRKLDELVRNGLVVKLPAAPGKAATYARKTHEGVTEGVTDDQLA